jgi:exodeoxyribonuclease VIII
MKDSEYHAHPALGSTSIKTMATGTPRSYWAKHVDPNREPFAPTDAMRQGSLVDCLITCPEEFQQKYVVIPDDAPKKPTSTQLSAKKPSEATIEAIQFWDNFNNSVGERDVISQEWFYTALDIRTVLETDATIGPVLAMQRQSQVPYFWIDEVHGIECKYKPDLEPEDGSLFDLKKGATAKPSLFERQAYSLGYDIQLNHYSKGFNLLHKKPPTRCGFIAYEWKWPHDCALILVDKDYLELGHKRRSLAIDKILKCDESGLYPSHGEATITRPKFTLTGGSASGESEIDPSDEIQLF